MTTDLLGLLQDAAKTFPAAAEALKEWQTSGVVPIIVAQNLATGEITSTDDEDGFPDLCDLHFDAGRSAGGARPDATSFADAFHGAGYVSSCALKELPRAAYLTLRTALEGDWQDPLTSLERAHEMGFFAIDLGLPDRPEMRNLAKFDEIDDAVGCLAMLRQSFPTIGLWLSTVEILAQITDPNVFHGVIQARATFDPSDDECDWNRLAKDVADGEIAPYGYDHNPAAERIAHFVGVP